MGAPTGNDRQHKRAKYASHPSNYAVSPQHERLIGIALGQDNQRDAKPQAKQPGNQRKTFNQTARITQQAPADILQHRIGANGQAKTTRQQGIQPPCCPAQPDERYAGQHQHGDCRQDHQSRLPTEQRHRWAVTAIQYVVAQTVCTQAHQHHPERELPEALSKENSSHCPCTGNNRQRPLCRKHQALRHRHHREG